MGFSDPVLLDLCMTITLTWKWGVVCLNLWLEQLETVLLRKVVKSLDDSTLEGLALRRFCGRRDASAAVGPRGGWKYSKTKLAKGYAVYLPIEVAP